MSRETWTLLVSLAGVLSAALLGWMNYRLHAKNNLFGNMHDLVETYRQEITRLKLENGELQRKLQLARKQAIAAQHEAAVCQERLEIERQLFERRLEEVVKQAKAIRPEPEINQEEDQS